MKVSLLHFTPSSVAVIGARTAYNSEDASDSGESDKNLMLRLFRAGHLSVFEHISFSFQIEGLSRGAHTELLRHRISVFPDHSATVKSTRFTLRKNLKKEEPFIKWSGNVPAYEYDKAGKYIVFTGITEIDMINIETLEKLRYLSHASGFSNDLIKYVVPDCLKTNLVWTVNMRSFFNFLSLRADKTAHKEMRELALSAYYAVTENADEIIVAVLKEFFSEIRISDKKADE